MMRFYRKLIALMVSFFPLAGSAENVWYGYYDGEEQLSEFGTGLGEAYDCAAFFAGDIGVASGKAISKVRFTLQGTRDMTGLRVWLSTKLPKSAADSDLGVYDVDISTVADGLPVEVGLPQQCWVPESGIYVGYSFQTTDPFPLLTTRSETTVPDEFYMKTTTSYPEWIDFSQYKYGNLAMEILLEGDTYANAVQVISVPEIVSFPGSDVVIPVRMVNYGTEGVSEIEYTLVEDGGEPQVVTRKLDRNVAQPKEEFIVNLDFPALDGMGISYKDLTVTKVNGCRNEMEEYAHGRGALITILKNAPRTTVMEEFTGTWCGWCPRGIAGMEALSSDFGGNFIGIAIHGGDDPMVIDDYSEILSSVENFPSCRLDREVSGDPFFGSTYGLGSEPSYGIRSDVETQLQKMTPAAVMLASEWTDGDRTGIRVSSAVKLQYPRQDAPDYGISYVICADGLRGEGNSWWQNNDFSLPMAQGYKDDPYLGRFTEAGSRIRDIAYDDVAIAAYGIDNGLDMSPVSSWDDGNWVDVDSRALDISGNGLVQDKERLSVVAMIVDRHSGRIVNAVKARVGERNSSDVSSVEGTEPAVAEAVYDLSGRRVARPSSGIFIVRYSDGRIRKIMSN